MHNYAKKIVKAVSASSLYGPGPPTQVMIEFTDGDTLIVAAYLNSEHNARLYTTERKGQNSNDDDLTADELADRMSA